MHYFPISLPVLLLLFVLFITLLILVEVHVLEYAYQAMGIDRRYVFVLLFFFFLRKLH